MILKGKDGTTYELEAASFAQGGEGEIYRVIGNNRIVAKLYKQGKNTQNKERKILRMINFPPEKSVLSQIAWPSDALYSNNVFVGFIMPKLDINEELNIVYEYGALAKYAQMSWSNRITIAKNLCAVINSIHEAGHTCGDLNPKNISVNTNTGRVVLVDTDSYHIRDGYYTYRCEVGIPEYLPAEVQNKMKAGVTLATASLPTFTQETDNFALAIHIFQLLMNGVHPFACAIVPSQSSVTAPQPSDNILRGNFPFMKDVPGVTIPPFAPKIDILPADIRELFRRAFISAHIKPNDRPTPYEWYEALKKMGTNLKECSKVSYHQYYNVLSTCPWCEADKSYDNRMMNSQKSSSTNSLNSNSTSQKLNSPTKPTSTTSSPSIKPTVQAPLTNQSSNTQVRIKTKVVKWPIVILLLILVGTIIYCSSIIEENSKLTSASYNTRNTLNILIPDGITVKTISIYNTDQNGATISGPISASTLQFLTVSYMALAKDNINSYIGNEIKISIYQPNGNLMQGSGSPSDATISGKLVAGTNIFNWGNSAPGSYIPGFYQICFVYAGKIIGQTAVFVGQ